MAEESSGLSANITEFQAFLKKCRPSLKNNQKGINKVRSCFIVWFLTLGNFMRRCFIFKGYPVEH